MTIDEFLKTELRVAKVIEAERIPESEKLLKLKVSLGGEGEEERQILSGIGKAYAPEDLVGKEVVIVANLDPRMMMGLESQGMVLAAIDEEGKPVLLVPDREVPPGAGVR